MEQILATFPPITLDEMHGIKLMNRIDTKYVTTRDMLRRFLTLAQEHYYVQDFNGRRMMPYHTIYLDTPTLEMYHDHQRGKKHRYKVRMRMYENEMEPFMEVKNKNNKGRTKKKRLELAEPGETTELIATPESLDFVQEKAPLYDAHTLQETIENRFRRITLVNKARTERLTIDLDLQFHNNLNGQSKELPEHVIIELKRDGLIPSPAIALLKQLRVKACGFSKMALGMAMTMPELKQNRFKQRLHYIEKLTKKP